MMSTPFRGRARTGLIVGALILGLTGCGSDSNGVNLILGETQSVSGVNVSTWSRVASDNTVLEVGVTVPFALIENPPALPGTGPAEAIATLAFPVQVQSTTYFNHFELQWEPSGHPPAFTALPHFDLHFYSIPPSQVRLVTAPDPVAPAADRIPTGYVYPGVNAVVPEMGVHGRNPAEYQGTFTQVFITGFYNGQLTFLEPAINRTYLMQKVSYARDVPRPAVLGRATRYPTQFTATYNSATDSYTFVFSEFVSVQ